MQNNLSNTSGRMENPYLSTPALLGLSQHTAGFSEALRMSRTFAHQAADSKEYGGGAFGGGPLALRSSFDFPSLPSPLFLTSPFLPAGMDPRLPFAGSAFHPVTSAAAAAAAAAASAPFDRKFFSPAKREPKPEPGGEYGEVSSTATTARRPGEEDERNSSGSERSSPEDGRARKRPPSPVDPSSCPVCGVALRPGEVADHCRAEMERLLQLNSGGRERRDRDGLGWETYHRVRGNRQLRLRCKLRKRRGEDPSDCGSCVSDRPDHQDTERLAPPAKRPATVTGAAVPASPGRPAAAAAAAEDEEEVDVLGDADCNGGSGGGVGDAGGNWHRPGDDSGATDLRTGVEVTRGSPGYEEGVPDTTAEKSSASSDHVAPLAAEVERLRAQLSALEHETSRCRCGVCGQTYRQPLVSTHCWHVHCTPCWNGALGGDRRCPQCGGDVAADDLNAIHV